MFAVAAVRALPVSHTNAIAAAASFNHARLKLADRFFFLLFVFFIVVPFSFLWLTLSPLWWTPPFLQNHLFLFAHHFKSYSTYYVQIRHDEAGPWVTLPVEELYFRMVTFGHQTRFQKFMDNFRTEEGDRARDELARWLKERYSAANPNEKLTALRFLRARTAASSTPRTLPWNKPALESYASEDVDEISVHHFEGGAHGATS